MLLFLISLCSHGCNMRVLRPFPRVVLSQWPFFYTTSKMLQSPPQDITSLANKNGGTRKKADIFLLAYSLDRLREENAEMRAQLRTYNQQQGTIVPTLTKSEQDTESATIQTSDVPLNNDLIDRIIRAQNPIYPITRQEVQKILALYADLPNRPISGIARVLNGQMHDCRSAIYAAIQKHVRQRNETLENYRKIYSKMTKSFGGCAVDMIQQLASEGRVDTPRAIRPMAVPDIDQSAKSNKGPDNHQS